MKNLLFGLCCFSLISFQSCNQEQVSHIKIMSYNIRHGKGLDTILNLTRSADVINSQKPDLVALQEIDHYCSRSDSTNQTQFLANATQMTGTFGKFMNYQNGQYGMATLSNKTIQKTTVLPLPDAKYEPRSSIVHEVEVSEDYTIVFANVHFDWISEEEGSENRLKQAQALIDYVDTLNKPAIITGDFNCTPDSPTMKLFEEQGFYFVDKGGDNLSFQGDDKLEIDHVIFRNTEHVIFNPMHVALLDVPIVSDHRPLVVEFEVVLD